MFLVLEETNIEDVESSARGNILDYRFEAVVNHSLTVWQHPEVGH